jgi:hypothetical protein
MDEKSIEDWCRKYGIYEYIIGDDGILNVNQSVFIYNLNLTKLPIQFGIVGGCFDCSFNKLTSLIGSPKIIDGYFYCYDNELATLKYGPEMVGDSYDCQRNRIMSLIGFPKSIGHNNPNKEINYFRCRNNPIFEEYNKFEHYSQYLRFIKINNILE